MHGHKRLKLKLILNIYFLAPEGAYEVQMLSLCLLVCGWVCMSVPPHYALQLPSTPQGEES